MATTYATFFACFLTFAHLFLAAFTIAALPAADKTRFLTPTTSRSAGPPNAFAAARRGTSFLVGCYLTTVSAPQTEANVESTLSKDFRFQSSID